MDGVGGHGDPRRPHGRIGDLDLVGGCVVKDGHASANAKEAHAHGAGLRVMGHEIAPVHTDGAARRHRARNGCGGSGTDEGRGIGVHADGADFSVRRPPDGLRIPIAGGLGNEGAQGVSLRDSLACGAHEAPALVGRQLAISLAAACDPVANGIDRHARSEPQDAASPAEDIRADLLVRHRRHNKIAPGGDALGRDGGAHRTLDHPHIDCARKPSPKANREAPILAHNACAVARGHGHILPSVRPRRAIDDGVPPDGGEGLGLNRLHADGASQRHAASACARDGEIVEALGRVS